MDAEHARAIPRGGAAGRALAAITLTLAALTLAACSSPGPSACRGSARRRTSGAAQLARVNFQPLPSSVVTLSGAQIAKIKADT